MAYSIIALVIACLVAWNGAAATVEPPVEELSSGLSPNGSMENETMDNVTVPSGTPEHSTTISTEPYTTKLPLTTQPPATTTPPPEYCESRGNPCFRGTCISLGPDSFRCECSSGWTGPRCFTPRDACTLHLCALGRCVVEAGRARCKCFAGYTGEHCTSPIPPPKIPYCQRYRPCRVGSCQSLGSSAYSCRCFSGWTGRNCDSRVTTQPPTTTPSPSCPDIASLEKIQYRMACWPRGGISRAESITQFLAQRGTARAPGCVPDGLWNLARGLRPSGSSSLPPMRPCAREFLRSVQRGGKWECDVLRPEHLVRAPGRDSGIACQALFPIPSELPNACTGGSSGGIPWAPELPKLPVCMNPRLRGRAMGPNRPGRGFKPTLMLIGL